MTFPMGNVATRQAVISILWRELFRNGQYIDDLLKQSHIVMPLLAHFQIFLRTRTNKFKTEQ